MRILFITSDYSLGGAENHALNLARGFQKQGHACHFWVFAQGDGTSKKICERENIPTRLITEFHHFRKWPERFFQIRHYVKLLNEIKPDVVISFNLRPNIWNGVVSKKAKIPCVIWSQQDAFPFPFNGNIEKKALRNIDLFISNAHHISDKFRNGLPIRIDPKKFKTVHNGYVPKEKADEKNWSRVLGEKGHNFFVTMVANLTKNKDHETLIRAWKIVLDQKPEELKPLLVLAGRLGDTAEFIKDLVRDLRVESHVLIAGSVSDIDSLNKHSQIGVLCSPSEGLPNSVMEQMAVGLPITGSFNDGIAELLSDSQKDYLVPQKDYQRLAKKILVLMNGPKERQELGRKNIMRIEQQFTQSRMVEGTLKLINTCINQKRLS